MAVFWSTFLYFICLSPINAQLSQGVDVKEKILFQSQPDPYTICVPTLPCFLVWKLEWSYSVVLTASFEKNGKQLPSNSGFINGSSLLFPRYSKDHSGSYTCIFQFGGKRFRSGTTVLSSTEPVGLSIYSSDVPVNDGVLMECWKDSYLNLKNFTLTWYKDNRQLENEYTLKERKLFIEHAHLSDVGWFQCGVKLSSQFELLSPRKLLNVTQTRKISETSIIYKTSNQVVQLNATVVVMCIANHAKDIYIAKKMNNLFKVRQSSKAKHVSFTIERFQLEDAGLYICSVVGSHLVREEIRLKFAVKPSVHDEGIVTTVFTRVAFPMMLKCSPTGSPLSNVTWFKNGVAVTEDFHVGNDFLEKSVVDVGDMAFYQCRMDNAFGSVSKYFLVEHSVSDYSVRNLTVDAISSTYITFSWLRPKQLRETNFIYYYLWSSAALVGRTKNTGKSTHNLQVTVTSEVFGGSKYNIQVCPYYAKSKLQDCVHIFTHTPAAYPLKGPLITSLYEDDGQTENEQNLCKNSYFCVRLNWEHKRWHSNGVVQYFKLFTLKVALPPEQSDEFIGDRESRLSFEYFNSNTNKTLCNLSPRSLIKIWMISSTPVGEGPMSNSYLVSGHPKWNVATNNRQASVCWESPYDQEERDAVVKWSHDHFYTKNDTLNGWIIYYVPIPFTDYWQSVKTERLDKTAKTSVFYNLNNTVAHRFSIFPIFNMRFQKYQKTDMLGNGTHLILNKNDNALNPKLKMVQNKKKIFHIDPPNSIKCVGISLTDILVSWSVPPTELLIDYYNVHLYTESGTPSKVYRAYDHYLRIGDLISGLFYAVNVVPYSNDTEEAIFSPSSFVSCKSDLQVPSVVRDIDYHFAQYATEYSHKMYLVVKWKEPVKTSGTVFAYELQLDQLPQKNILPAFKYGTETYYVIRTEEYREWVYSPKLAVHSGMYFKVQVAAINSAGRGVKCNLTTRDLNAPTEEVRVDVPTHASDHQHHEHLQAGVVIGLSVSAVFLFIFLVVAIIKRPFKSITRYKERIRLNREGQEFLYLQRLNELHSASSSAACQGCGGTCSTNLCDLDNSHYTVSKLIDPLRRLFLGKRSIHYTSTTSASQRQPVPNNPDRVTEHSFSQQNSSISSFQKLADSISSSRDSRNRDPTV